MLRSQPAEQFRLLSGRRARRLTNVTPTQNDAQRSAQRARMCAAMIGQQDKVVINDTALPVSLQFFFFQSMLRVLPGAQLHGAGLQNYCSLLWCRTQYMQAGSLPLRVVCFAGVAQVLC